MLLNPTFAVLADVHGNSWALDAVLSDLRRRGIQQIFNLGDSLYGPLDPAGVAERLVELNFPGVRGNQDRALLQPPAAPQAGSTLGFVCSSLGAVHRAWLSAMPPTRRFGDELFLCHGSPDCDEEYLLEEVRAEGVFLRSETALATKTAL